MFYFNQLVHSSGKVIRLFLLVLHQFHHTSRKANRENNINAINQLKMRNSCRHFSVDYVGPECKFQMRVPSFLIFSSNFLDKSH
jgi:hypothetical protein